MMLEQGRVSLCGGGTCSFRSSLTDYFGSPTQHYDHALARPATESGPWFPVPKRLIPQDVARAETTQVIEVFTTTNSTRGVLAVITIVKQSIMAEPKDESAIEYNESSLNEVQLPKRPPPAMQQVPVASSPDSYPPELRWNSRNFRPDAVSAPVHKTKFTTPVSLQAILIVGDRLRGQENVAQSSFSIPRYVVCGITKCACTNDTALQIPRIFSFKCSERL